MAGSATGNILGGIISTIGEGYGDYLDSENRRRELEAERQIGIANAQAQANQGLISRDQFQLVLLGAGALVGLMIWRMG